MKDNTLNETTSPIDAANGVATLSGFKLNLCAINITATRTKSAPNINKMCKLVVKSENRFIKRYKVTLKMWLTQYKA